MFSIIEFNGGLGNQMFQYAFYLQLKKRHPLNLFLFDIELSQECHNGYEIDKIFQIDSTKQTRNFRLIKRFVPYLINSSKIITHENGLQYKEKYLNEKSLFVRYEGYWQSELYFLDIEDIVRKVFSFRLDNLSHQTKSLSSKINQGNFVSVHIRRGDYLTTGFYGPCTPAYYQRAMENIQTIIPQATFVFFSDDIKWVKENIKTSNGIYVSWNKGIDSWQDMYLMSQCSHNIIANSSFSWWGAWLNNNPRKIVIAPNRWFDACPNYDILPSTWKTM